MNRARISAYKSLVYLSISEMSRLGKFYSMESIKEKFTEEQGVSGCVGSCAPEDCVSMLNHRLESTELFFGHGQRVRKSKASL